MILGIDASNLHHGGGVTHLVEFLNASNPDKHGFSKIIVWACKNTLEQIEDKPWLKKTYDPVLDRNIFFRTYWQRFILKKKAVNENCDVLFVPGGRDASRFRPFVTMSRNLLPFEYDEMKRFGFSALFFKNIILRISQSRTFKRADGVIFLTQYARCSVMRVVKKFQGKLITIPHGVNSKFLYPPRSQYNINQYTINNPYRILYVSIVDMYKHQWYVADAVAKIRSSGLPVCIEFVGKSYLPALKRLKKTLKKIVNSNDFIVYRGNIPYRELPLKYKNADMIVFASSCENMPNILLEGMAAGLPIACSDRGPMPEILGNAGIFFNPENSEDIEKAILSLIKSPEIRYEKALESYNRALKYSWQRCANDTLSFLSQFANKTVNGKIIN